jgi:geranylgeranyl pyrophosphate synthase
VHTKINGRHQTVDRADELMQLKTALLTSAICGLSALAAQTDVFAEPSSEFAAAVQRLLQDELNRRQGLKLEGAGKRSYASA